jgi:ADP-ribosylglycohydrolase
MRGAIAGDIIGSPYEGTADTNKDFPLFVARSRFTDDTVMTVAVADAIEHHLDYAASMRLWGRRYPHAGYGGWFRSWLWDDGMGAYNSFGNGSAMRVSAIGWAFSDLDTVLGEAKASAEVTHNHPEGIKGAQAVAASIYLARTGHDKTSIRSLLEKTFGYQCDATVNQLRKTGGFDVTSQGTVPAATVCFLESTDFEDAVRNAVSLGGDTDTLACIAGAVAEAFYGNIPDEIMQQVEVRLNPELEAVVDRFVKNYCGQ